MNPAEIATLWAADRAARRCGYHDTLLDPDTGRCDYCRTCPACKGDGIITVRHARWGTRDCPWDYDEPPCPACDEKGQIP